MMDVLVSLASVFIVIRCGCLLNRMRHLKAWPLGLSYVSMGVSAMAVALAPFYNGEYIGYYSIVISTALILGLDKRLWKRVDLNNTPATETEKT